MMRGCFAAANGSRENRLRSQEELGCGGRRRKLGGLEYGGRYFFFSVDYCSRDDFSNGTTVLSANTKYCQRRDRLRCQLLVKFHKERPFRWPALFLHAKVQQAQCCAFRV